MTFDDYMALCDDFDARIDYLDSIGYDDGDDDCDNYDPDDNHGFQNGVFDNIIFQKGFDMMDEDFYYEDFYYEDQVYDLIDEAERFDAEFYGDDITICEDDGDYDDLLDELDFIFQEFL